MEIRLDGRRAIVTGSTLSSSNMGYAIARGPAEVANLVVFLAPDHAAAITGASLRVDGGIVRFIV